MRAEGAFSEAGPAWCKIRSFRPGHIMSQPVLEHIVCTLGDHAVRMGYWQWGEPAAGHVVLCVHGLTRQGRDFDALASELIEQAHQRGLPPLRIVCPDMPGRGQSAWLPDPALYQIPVYVQGMVQLLTRLAQQAPVDTLDWVGTSMGGLIGMGLASLQGSAAWPAQVPSLAHLVLNDVGPQITHASVARIGAYAGDTGHYASEAEALQALQERFAAFGPHTQEEWARLNRPMLRPHPAGGLRLHYDPALADAFREVPREAFDAGTQVLWKLYDALSTPTLVIRGAESDLLTPEAAHAMQMRGPRAHVVEIAGAGHAPALDHAAEMQPIADFLLGSSGVSRV